MLNALFTGIEHSAPSTPSTPPAGDRRARDLSVPKSRRPNRPPGEGSLGPKPGFCRVGLEPYLVRGMAIHDSRRESYTPEKKKLPLATLKRTSQKGAAHSTSLGHLTGTQLVGIGAGTSARAGMPLEGPLSCVVHGAGGVRIHGRLPKGFTKLLGGVAWMFISSLAGFGGARAGPLRCRKLQVFPNNFSW